MQREGGVVLEATVPEHLKATLCYSKIVSLTAKVAPQDSGCSDSQRLALVQLWGSAVQRRIRELFPTDSDRPSISRPVSLSDGYSGSFFGVRVKLACTPAQLAVLTSAKRPDNYLWLGSLGDGCGRADLQARLHVSNDNQASSNAAHAQQTVYWLRLDNLPVRLACLLMPDLAALLATAGLQVHAVQPIFSNGVRMADALIVAVSSKAGLRGRHGVINISGLTPQGKVPVRFTVLPLPQLPPLAVLLAASARTPAAPMGAAPAAAAPAPPSAMPPSNAGAMPYVGVLPVAAGAVSPHAAASDAAAVSVQPAATTVAAAANSMQPAAAARTAAVTAAAIGACAAAAASTTDRAKPPSNLAEPMSIDISAPVLKHAAAAHAGSPAAVAPTSGAGAPSLQAAARAASHPAAVSDAAAISMHPAATTVVAVPNSLQPAAAAPTAAAEAAIRMSAATVASTNRAAKPPSSPAEPMSIDTSALMRTAATSAHTGAPVAMAPASGGPEPAKKHGRAATPVGCAKPASEAVSGPPPKRLEVDEAAVQQAERESHAVTRAQARALSKAAAAAAGRVRPGGRRTGRSAS